MKLKLRSTLIALFCFVLILPAIAEEDKPITIGLIGDSTVATMYGWGPALEDRVNDKGRVLHYAKNGATLQSLSKKLDELIAEKPDYVLIQFGHNDMKRYDPEVYSEKLTDYVHRLKKAGIKPVMLSSVTRRVFNQDGRIRPVEINGRTLRDYAVAAKDDATSERALVVDGQIRNGGIFGNDVSDVIKGSPAHGNQDDAARSPLGGNHIYGDGSGQWVPWSNEWRRLHSWIAVDTRDLFWVQKDLGDFENEPSLLP